MFPYLLSFTTLMTVIGRRIPGVEGLVSFFLDLPRGWYPRAQPPCCSPDAEIKACTENEPLLLIEEECFDAPSVARKQRRHFFHSRRPKKPHFPVCGANGYQVSTTVMDYSASV